MPTPCKCDRGSSPPRGRSRAAQSLEPTALPNQILDLVEQARQTGEAVRVELAGTDLEVIVRPKATPEQRFRAHVWAGRVRNRGT